MYLVLYLMSKRRVLYTGASWVGAEGKAVTAGVASPDTCCAGLGISFNCRELVRLKCISSWGLCVPSCGCYGWVTRAHWVDGAWVWAWAYLGCGNLPSRS
ncbi:hypothetical protein N656DRAFT_403265 [Canariomyces notabilis]|uniref:Uncharacterized protein n=1 Tax=Canariomyces notabilis TaxID=2074819 RepID=A0AAN6TK12_9PEZI|nr:hypothetical protein N656DRAFT_403265 [Canariomyces arenarius]